MQSNSALAWERVGDVLLIVHATQPPSDAEWDELFASPDASAPLGMIVVSNGTKPSPKQRAQIQDRFGNAKTAVLTDSLITRGAITALSWFGMPIRAFVPTDVPSAIAFAGVPSTERARVRSRLDRLSARLAAHVAAS